MGDLVADRQRDRSACLADAVGAGRRVRRRGGELRGRRAPGGLPARQRRPATCPRFARGSRVFRAADRRTGSTRPRRPARRSANGMSRIWRCRIAREPGRWACRCDACQEAFQDRFGETDAGDGHSRGRGVRRRSARRHAPLAGRRRASDAVCRARSCCCRRELRPRAVARRCRRCRASATSGHDRILGLRRDPPSDDARLPDRSGRRRILAATAGTDAEPLGWVQAFGVPAGREQEIERGDRDHATQE